MVEALTGEPRLVDYLSVELPTGAGNISAEMAAELASLVENGIIRLLGLFVLVTRDDGSLRAVELADLPAVEELPPVDAQITELLGADDVARLATGMAPGRSAGVVVWENLWAAPFGAATRRSGGRLVSGDHGAVDAIAAALGAARTDAPPRRVADRGR